MLGGSSISSDWMMLELGKPGVIASSCALLLQSSCGTSKLCRSTPFLHSLWVFCKLHMHTMWNAFLFNQVPGYPQWYSLPEVRCLRLEVPKVLLNSGSVNGFFWRCDNSRSKNSSDFWIESKFDVIIGIIFFIHTHFFAGRVSANKSSLNDDTNAILSWWINKLHDHELDYLICSFDFSMFFC